MDELVNRWREAGLAPGGLLLLHSNLQRTLRSGLRTGKRWRPADILASFLEVLGPSGTLLLPLFNFDFTRGVPFDIRMTPSQMGALTEAGRLDPRSVRTGHPIYSFAVIGADAAEFADVNNYSGYGSDSPFAILRQRGGRIAVLDLPDQNSMTFYHHVEEMLTVDYRYHKSFTAAYTDGKGRTEERCYGLFVRDLERGVCTDVDAMGQLLWTQGVYQGDCPGVGSGLRWAEADAIFQSVTEVIESGRAEGLLYRREGVTHG